MQAPVVRMIDSRVVIRNTFTRLPFRFGVVTMEAMPTAILEVRIEFSDGSTATGVASDFLAYKWFDKSPEKSPADNVDDLLLALRDARAIYLDAGKANPFDLWLTTRQEIENRAVARGFNRLGASFAISMMERAVMDAVGRHNSASFDQMVRSNLLGMRPGAVLAEVGISDVISALPARPLSQVDLRHTVGLVDAITDADRSVDDPDDGYPVTLEEYLATDKLNYLKVKLSGDPDADLNRLGAIAAVTDATGRKIMMTMDGNEQYHDLDEFAGFVGQINSRPRLRTLWNSVMFIEQPLHRDVAMAEPLSEAAKLAIGRPLLIDEADGWAEAFHDAIEMGYEGVSHKNCKGIYRSLINAGLTLVRNRAAGENRYFQSGEDLTNLAVVPLQADLAVAATLGISHVERNGHHYFAGLNHLPAPEQESALIAHPDLYVRGANGVALRIDDGKLNISSLQVAGLGIEDHPDLNNAIPEAEWDFSMLETKS